MALTQEQWYQKLKGLVPNWYFETEKYQRAHFLALAKLLSALQEISEQNVDATFIRQAEDEDLDLHGYERGIDRLTEEPDETFAIRIQNIGNSVNLPAIKSIVDSLLLTGECEIREGTGPDNPFLNRSSFLNRAEILNDFRYNTFTIVIDKQKRTPEVFASRSYLSRSEYLSSDDSSIEFYQRLTAAVDAAKAFGVLYKVVERN